MRAKREAALQFLSPDKTSAHRPRNGCWSVRGPREGNWNRVIASGCLWVAVLLTIAASCDTFDVGYTKIGDVLKNPSLFDGRQVKVRGKVVDVLKLPFVETKFYMLKDETGEVLVATESALPGVEVEVRVRGSVQSMAIIGGKSIGLHLRESQRW